MSLPKFDKIPSLHETEGMYRLDRWPSTIKGQQDFLKEVAELWGEGSTVGFVEPYDGYPGYIIVSPEKDIRQAAEEKERRKNIRDSALQKLSEEERKILGI
jgi:hypothetical protein